MGASCERMDLMMDMLNGCQPDLSSDLVFLDRGRGGVSLPALRTVRAVFPHTALQSVVSSSRLSRSLPGRVEREQPSICEEGNWPSLMIGACLSEAGPARLLAQHRPQATPDQLVECEEGPRVGMLEASEPAPKRRVETGDHEGEASPPRPWRLFPNRLLELVQALLAHVTPTALEPVAEKLESVP